MHLSADGAVVDVDDAGEDVIDRAHGLVHVPGEDGGGEPVFDVVEDPHGLFKRLCFDEVGHRPEDLLFRNPHAGGHVIEDGGRVERASPQRSFVGPAATDQDPGALLLADLHIFVHPLQLRIADDGPNLRLGIQPIPQPQPTGPIHQTRGQI